MSDVVSSANNQADEPLAQLSRSRKLMRFLGLVLIVVSVFAGWYLFVGYLGWQNGQKALIQERETEMATQLARQIDLARENIAQGSHSLALRRLEYVLELDPNYREAEALRQQAQAPLYTPQATTPATATPTPLPEPTATPGIISDPQQELQRIRRLAANQDWEAVAPATIVFQRQFPNYERQESNQLLYDAYVNLGLALVEGEQIELGLFYLEQAEKLGDLSQEALDFRLWAELYAQGISFYGVNWGVTTYYFRELCLSAPFYQLSCERLTEALIQYADQYAAALDWCPAQELYQEALGYGRTPILVEKVNQAAEACLLATPTPSTIITGTLPITNTEISPGSSLLLLTPTPLATRDSLNP